MPLLGGMLVIALSTLTYAFTTLYGVLLAARAVQASGGPASGYGQIHPPH